MGEHIESPLPRQKSSGQRGQFEAALEDAQARLAWIESNAPGNALAIRNQQRIIKQWERQLADLTSEDWLNE